MEVIFHYLLNALCGFVANIVSGFILGVIKPLLCSVVYFRGVILLFVISEKKQEATHCSALL